MSSQIITDTTDTTNDDDDDCHDGRAFEADASKLLDSLPPDMRGNKYAKKLWRALMKVPERAMMASAEDIATIQELSHKVREVYGHDGLERLQGAARSSFNEFTMWALLHAWRVSTFLRITEDGQWEIDKERDTSTEKDEHVAASSTTTTTSAPSASSNQKSLRATVEAETKRAYWNIQRDVLQQAFTSLNSKEQDPLPPHPSKALRVLLPHFKELQTSISQYLVGSELQEFTARCDFHMLEQDEDDDDDDNKVLEEKDLTDWMATFTEGLGKCEAPARHEETQKFVRHTLSRHQNLADSSEAAGAGVENAKKRTRVRYWEDVGELVITLLSFFFNQLDIMKRDIASYQLNRVSKKERALAEQKHVVTMLQKGTLAISKVENFMKSTTLSSSPPISSDTSPEPYSASALPSSMLKLFPEFLKRLSRLIACPVGVGSKGLQSDDNLLPEILSLEISRLRDTQNYIHKAALIGGIATLISPRIPQAIRDSPNLLKRFYVSVADKLPQTNLSCEECVDVVQEVLLACLEECPCESSRYAISDFREFFKGRWLSAIAGKSGELIHLLLRRSQQGFLDAVTREADAIEHFLAMGSRRRSSVSSINPSSTPSPFPSTTTSATSTATHIENLKSSSTSHDAMSHNEPQRLPIEIKSGIGLPQNRQPRSPSATISQNLPQGGGISLDCLGTSPAQDLSICAEILETAFRQFMAIAEPHWHVYGFVYKKVFMDMMITC